MKRKQSSVTINRYVKLAKEYISKIRGNVQNGFEIIVPKRFQKPFLKKMENEGWILDIHITEKCIKLIPRYKFCVTSDGQFCYKYDRLLKKKIGGSDYLFDV